MFHLGNVEFNKIHSLLGFLLLSCSFLRIININCDCPRGEKLYAVFSKLIHSRTIFLIEALGVVFQGHIDLMTKQYQHTHYKYELKNSCI